MNNHHIGLAEQPYAEGLTTLQVTFLTHNV